MYLLTWLSVGSSTCLAQQREKDSLLQILTYAPLDTQRVNVINNLVWVIKDDEAATARQYSDEAQRIATQLGFDKGLAQAYNDRGVLEAIHHNIPSAIDFYQKALAIRAQLNDQKGVASLYNNIGNAYQDQSDYINALENLRKSLKIRENMGDKTRAARAHYNISVVHESMGNYYEAQQSVFQYLAYMEQLGDQEGIGKAYNVMGNIKTELELWDEASEYYNKAATIFRNLDDKEQLATIYNNIGNNKDDYGSLKKDADDKAAAQKLFQEALGFHEQALALRLTLNDDVGISDSYNNIGQVYKHLGALDQALDYLQRALSIRAKLDNKKGVMECYNGLGDVYRRKGNLAKAEYYTAEYLKIAMAINDDKFVQKAYKDFSDIYAQKGNFKLAYEYRKKYDDLRYKRLDEQRTKDFQRKEVMFNDGKRQLEIERQDRMLAQRDAQLQRANSVRNSLIIGSVILSLLALLLYNRYRYKHKTSSALEAQNTIIESERKRSDELLLNILPEAIANELKSKGKATAKRYDQVTVMFTDFKGFTNIAETLSPEAVVSQLDCCFKAFDKIIDKYDIEKIKTIGDAYMCASGLPVPSEDHAINMVRAAQDMLTWMASFQSENRLLGLPIFEMRIGIHSGSVVAGVVGDKKFAYDIWGDTVNIAARMESSGEIGKINISENTYNFVKNNVICTSRGKIEAKNKGQIEMYFVES